jgi:hypothetical protein
MRAVIDGLGSSYESAWTFRSTMAPGRHDGASVGRLDAYDPGCECFKYIGRDYEIPG